MPLLALYLIVSDNGFDPCDIPPNIADRMTVFQIFSDGLAAKPKQLFLQVVEFFGPFIRS